MQVMTRQDIWRRLGIGIGIGGGALLVGMLAAGSHGYWALRAAAIHPFEAGGAVVASRMPAPLAPERVASAYAALPLAFEANMGQADPHVRFLSPGHGYAFYLTDEGAAISLNASATSSLTTIRAPGRALRLKFAGDRTHSAIAGRDLLPSKSNYFIGNDPKQWRTNVPNYAAVEYRGIYPGVDAVFRGDKRALEFDFDIEPGADPGAIGLEVDGARDLELDQAGEVVMEMDDTRDLVMGQPHIYQQSPAGRRRIEGRYVLSGGNRVGFALGPYDRAQKLVIDPTLAYSTYLGGGVSLLGSSANAIGVDSSGDAYVAGFVGANTVQFPTTAGSYNPGPVSTSVAYSFISKLKSDGSGLVYSTYFGGNFDGGGDRILAIAVDSAGAVYFGGYSGGKDNTPTTAGALMPVRPGINPSPFVAKLSSDGSTLVYSTYLDGSLSHNAGDEVLGIAVDSSFNAYVTGLTTASNFPTTSGAFQTVFKANPTIGNAFVTKLSADGSSLVYSTLLGGSTGEGFYFGTGGNAFGEAGAIAVDNTGNAYVTGSTLSTDFPTAGAYISACNSPCRDAYVSKLNPNGSALVYSTFLGGTGANLSAGLGIAVDTSNAAFVAGATTAANFPTTSGALQILAGAGFITKFEPNGSAPVYSSYLNGYGQSVAVGSDDGAVVFGLSTTSLSFQSTVDAFTIPACASSPCNFDFISKLSADGTGLIFSSPIGANQECCTASGALDTAGNAYIAGSTAPQGLPTTAGSFEPVLPNNYTGATPFVAKVAFATGPALANYSTVGPINFGSVNVNASSTQTLKLTNGGGQPFTFNGTSFIGPDTAFTVSGVSCNGSNVTLPLAAPVTLNSGGTCTFTLQFAPSSLGGHGVILDVGTSTQNSLATADPTNTGQAFLLQGTGVAPDAVFSVSQISFGNVIEGANATQTFTLSNMGTGPLVLQIVSLTIGRLQGFSFSVSCNGTAENPLPSPFTVNAGTTCTFTVQFAPVALGAATQGLGFEDNAAGGTETNLPSTGAGGGLFTQSVALSGVGIAAPPPSTTATVSAGINSGNFGAIDMGEPSADQQFQVTVTGAEPLFVTAIGFTGPNANDFQELDNCTSQSETGGIATSASCFIDVYFVPSSAVVNAEVAESAALTISGNATIANTPLSGQSAVALSGAFSLATPLLVSEDNVSSPDAATPAGVNSIFFAGSPAVSSGGQFVAFALATTNLPGPVPFSISPPPSAIYLRNTCQGAWPCDEGTTYVSYAPPPGQPGAGGNAGLVCDANTSSSQQGNRYPAIDATGEFVAFTSDDCQSAGTSSTNLNQIYLRDVTQGVTTLVTLDSNAQPFNAGADFAPFSMSSNGQFFAMQTTSGNVVASVPNAAGTDEVYWRNVCTGQAGGCAPGTILVSQDVSGQPGNSKSEQPSISPDGRYVAFASTATNLVSNPASIPAAEQVYLRDTCTGVAAGSACTPATLLISQDSSGNVLGGTNPAVALGGRYVAFVSSTAGVGQVYLRDTCTHNGANVCPSGQNPSTTLLSQANGSAGNGSSSPPSISSDGRIVTFTSTATNLDPSAASGTGAIYEYDTCLSNGVAVASPCNPGLNPLPVASSLGAPSSGNDAGAVVDASGQFVAFSTFAGASNPAGGNTEVYLGATTAFSPANAVFSITSFPTAILDQTSTSATLTLANTGSQPLILSFVLVTPTQGTGGGSGENLAPFAIDTSNVTCNGAPAAFALVTNPLVIKPGGSCNFAVSFNPTDEKIDNSQGPKQSGTIVFSDNAAASNEPNQLSSFSTVPYAQSVGINAELLYSANLQVISSASAAAVGAPVTLTATVLPPAGESLPPSPGGSNKPTGTVTFLAGQVNLGTETLSSQTATLATSSLPAGADVITATYSGDANYASETSVAGTTVTVEAAGYTIAASPSSLTLAAGQSGSTTITITPTAPFASPSSPVSVSISCGSLPSFITCGFVPPSPISVSGSAPVTTVLTVSVAENIALGVPSGPLGPGAPLRLIAAMLTLAMALALGALFAGKNRRRYRYAGMAVVIVAVIALGGFIGGCSNSPAAATSNLPPAGPQSVTVSAASNSGGNVSQQLQLTITITN